LRSVPARNASAALRHAPVRQLLGGRVVNGLGNAVAPIALDVRHLRHRLPERAPAVMEELPA
jgi:hypothetical protein